MRKARKNTLIKTGIFHKMWRGHNREHVLENDLEKRTYLEKLEDTYTEKRKLNSK